MRTAVVALGGNALLRGDQLGTIQEQEVNTYETCKCIVKLLSNYDSLVITHGNGPQVGNILLRNEAGNKMYGISKMPLDICVADSQGGIGYLTERQLVNVLIEQGIDKEVVTIVTQVRVDEEDPAFLNPTKPVGPYYTKAESDALASQYNWKFKEDPRGRGWRRVVPSPKPKEIYNKQIMQMLAEAGNLVIAAGGGGIPVIKKNNWFSGVEAVIDKDLSAAMLANTINASSLFILTDIQKVAINFKKPGERFLDTMTVAEAEAYYGEGHFEAGSMGPKVLAAIEFIRGGGERCVITDARALDSISNGTIITK